MWEPRRDIQRKFVDTGRGLVQSLEPGTGISMNRIGSLCGRHGDSHCERIGSFV